MGSTAPVIINCLGHIGRAALKIRERIRATGAEANKHRPGEVVLDLLTRRARVSDRDVELSAREFALAAVFFRHAGQVLSRERR